MRVKETTGPEKEMGIQAPQNGTAMRMLRLAARSTVRLFVVSTLCRRGGCRVGMSPDHRSSPAHFEPIFNIGELGISQIVRRHTTSSC